MLIVVRPRAAASLVRTNRLGMQLTRSLLMLGMPVCFLIAARGMSLPGVLSVFWLVPLLVMALAHRLGERVGVRDWAAGALAFIGVQLVLRPDGNLVSWGAVAALGMALCFGWYLSLTQRLEGETISANLFYTAAGVFVLLSIGAPSFWRWPTAGDALLMAGIGSLGLFALFALDMAVRESGAVVAAVAACSQPVWDVLAASLLGTDWPAATALCGVALVGGAMLLTVMLSPEATAA
jgi:drug/metabolite transporter (DMT)-like permease